MPSADTLINMPDLGLQAQAELHFGFLVTEKGYKCVQSTPHRVRFESPTTFVDLVYDGNRSYELGLLVGEKIWEASGNPAFSIAEILRLRHAPEAKTFSFVQISSSEVLASFVKQLAQALRAYGDDFVSGNEESFAELAKQRRSEVKAYALERDLRVARARAETAWHKKDYYAVVKALKPLRAALTASEIGKLEFAEKQIGSDRRS